MKLNITNKKDNKLLKRTEIEFEIDHAGAATPTRIDMREAIAAKLASDSELVVISKFKTSFGAGKSQGTAHQYKNAKDLSAIEPKYIIKRFEEKPVEKKDEPAEEAPAEQSEAPAEQPTEAPAEQDSGSSKLAEG